MSGRFYLFIWRPVFRPYCVIQNLHLTIVIGIVITASDNKLLISQDFTFRPQICLN